MTSKQGKKKEVLKRIARSHEHNHNNEVSWGRRLAATMVMNLIIPIVQIYGGIIAGSMALISDAIHNLSDFVSVFVSYLALKMGGRGPDYKQTFGYKRIEVFAAVFNVALLFGAGFYIAIEAWQRLLHPQPIQAKIVIAIAAAAFVANAISTILLMAGAKENLNIRSAFIHMLTDTLMSLGIVALGILWLYLPWYWLDPVFSWIIVAMIFYSGWGILKEAFFIFMNATPPGIDLTDIQRKIEALEGVKEIHHLHAWNLSSEGIALGQITPGPVFITATFIGFKVKGIIGALVATIGIFTPSLAAIILVGRAHAKIKNLKIVKVTIKGFLSGFIGLLLAVVYQFGVHSLISWQTWTIFAVSIAYLIGWKKDAIWLILGIICVSLLMF